MFQLCVKDIDSAYKIAELSRHKQKLTLIQCEQWGKVFYLTGPAGELWHVTQLAKQ